MIFNTYYHYKILCYQPIKATQTLQTDRTIYFIYSSVRLRNIVHNSPQRSNDATKTSM